MENEDFSSTEWNRLDEKTEVLINGDGKGMRTNDKYFIQIIDDREKSDDRDLVWEPKKIFELLKDGMKLRKIQELEEIRKESGL